MNFNQPKKSFRQLLFGFGVLLYRFGLARLVIGLSPNRLRAMLYHAVEPRTNDWTEGLGVNVTPEEFAANLDYFQKYYNARNCQLFISGRVTDEVIQLLDQYLGQLPIGRKSRMTKFKLTTETPEKRHITIPNSMPATTSIT